MKYVIGIDVGGKRADLAAVDPLDPHHPTLMSYVPFGVLHDQAAREAPAAVRPFFESYPPSVVWIEEPRGANPRAIFQLSVMAGAILSAVPEQAHVDFITAPEWKRLIGLPGNANKGAVMAWATMENPPTEPLEWEEHLADAYAMARAILAFGAKVDVA